MQRPKAHLIDFSGLFFRYYFAPGPEIFNEDGWDVSTVLGCTRWLLNQDELFSADVVVVAFDESLGSGFRHHIDEDYKANRPLPTDDIIYQFACLKSVCEFLGFQALASDVYEADDLIAVAVNQLPDHEVVIHTRDKDLRQLLDQHVSMLDFVSGKNWTESLLLEEEGLRPDQVPLYLALVGDTSDNIQGIPAVGDKTAKLLIEHFDNWDGIYQAVNDEDPLPVRGAKRIAENLLAFADLIPHNLSLTLLQNDSDIAEVALRQPAEWDELEAFIDLVGLNKPLSKLLQRVRS